MYSIPGIIIALSGLVWLLISRGIIELPDFHWSQYGPALIMAIGAGLAIAGRKIGKYKSRVVTIFDKIVEKVDSLYESSEALTKGSADPELNEMLQVIKLYSSSSPLYRASKFWESLFVRHIRWLRENGVSNFKRSVNLGYFQWKIGLKTDQLISVLRNARPAVVLRNFLKIHISAPLTDDVGTARQNPFVYRLFMAGLIEKVKSADQSRLLADIDEPQLGNPWKIYYEDKLISQDLCNSLIEYLSISNEVTLPSQLVVGELGAGYGRLAYVFLKVRKGVKYVISDIPPAIFVSQWYLSRLFPDKKIFKVRPFKDFREIQEDYEQSEIAFFLPEQLELLPEKHFGLFINISSLGEMKLNQIGNYFSQIERLTRGYFYTKQWITSVNLNDNIIIRQGDYPVSPLWQKIYERPALVQKRFFEALYRIN